MTTVDQLSVLLAEPLPAAVERVRAALKAEGFGVLTEVDIQATLREKLGADFYPYRLLGACNPDFAYRALEIDPSLGTFLPCTVAVYSTGDGTEVHIQDPLLAVPDNAPEGLEELVQGVRSALGRVVTALRASG